MAMGVKRDWEDARMPGCGNDGDLSVRQPGRCFNVVAADKSSQSVVWISLYNYLVTRNNGVEPGNMPKTFNEPSFSLCVGVS